MRASYQNRRFSFAALAAALILALAATPARALDQYPGDTVIYGVSTGVIQPNVLVILDNSGSMSEEVITGPAYNPATIYPVTNGCQGQPCDTNKVYRWRGLEHIWQGFINDVSTITCANAYNSLTTIGSYQGILKTNGTCTGPLTASFALGNYINWLTAAGGVRTKMEVAKEVMGGVLDTTMGVRFGMMIFNSSQGGHIAGVGDSYGWNGYQSYIKDMDAIFTGTTTNRTALKNTVNNLEPTTSTPLAETLFEAMRYYKGAQTSFNGSYTYTTPIQYSCQKNYVILITDGMSTNDRDAVLRSICNNGDCDGDGYEPDNDPAKSYAFQGSDYLDDVAKYIYDNDMLPDVSGDDKTIGKQNILTYTVGFGLAGNPGAEKLLSEAAYNGGGVYYSAMSTSGLSEALRQILSNIIEDNTSFVAPVLPVSPENRTYSGNRLYMGYFKPKATAFWSGNLKKYSLGTSGEILDKNGNPATNADGSLRDNAVSYWSTTADGGDVEDGGVGKLLLTRATDRAIYTYTGTSLLLTDSTNAFTTANAAITSVTLNVADSTEKDRLVNYVHGKDAYDADGNGNTTEKRGWIMGDVLHSRPTVVTYSSYSMADESNCGVNLTRIFVGTNDGMIHAFRDCDGREDWAFIPPDLLPYLKHMPTNTHTYYVDATPMTYVYDADRDGFIETGDGDKVILLFGQRRGGGWYYALDISTPASPRLLWMLSSTFSPSGTHTDYSELGESWSEPVITKVLVDVSGTPTPKVAAFIGAGYDNTAEDADPVTANTKGRGVYAVEIATLNSGVPSFTNSGRKIWGYTYAQNAALTKAIPAQLSVADIDGNGYADRIYVPDVGANLWRFDIGSTDVATWSGRKIFASNPGADSSTGRKAFYRPAVTLEVGYELVFYGTGDREHPTDTAVVDRLYAVKDTGQTATKTEGDLSDATSTPSVNISSTWGWYIKLNVNSGEKALASPSVINKVAYYTTYQPVGVSASPECGVVNRGTARLYALKYLSAGAAYNFDTGNDSPDVTLGTTDRSTVLGTGIPSGMVTVINPGGISAIVGVGGALVVPVVDDTGGSLPTYWREVR